MSTLRSIALYCLLCCFLNAEGRRVVVIKLDGVPGDLLHTVMQEQDPKAGRSRLPWFQEVFGNHGTRIESFYVRGISLSAPSWAMLETGWHQRIHGNVEWDRVTLRVYDYLNFFRFYFSNLDRGWADMPGVQVLDDSGVPLIIDRFAWPERYQSFQLYERWIRWQTLKRSLPSHFKTRSPRELLDEWLTGLDLSSSISEQDERELINDLGNPEYRYLDYFTGEFDHIAHLNNSREAQIRELQHIDALIGRVWTAIRSSPLAAQTILAVVSDHGINSSEAVYSQGYNLVDWFGGPEGGGHHSGTNRYPLDQYKLRGLNFMVSEVITPSRYSSYLKDESEQYPTVFLDLDGNERAAVQLRNSDLNALHILCKELSKKDLPKHLRTAASGTFFDILDARRDQWRRSLTELREESNALHRAIERGRAREPVGVKVKWTRDELDQGLEQPSRRFAARLKQWEQDEHSYREYVRIMSNLLALKRGVLHPQQIQIDELIPKRSLAEPNTLYDLQNYVVGPSREGLVAAANGERLDVVESFRRIDYFRALRSTTVRNNVQASPGVKPIDFIAARVPVPDVEEAVWLYSDEEHEVLVLGRTNSAGALELRYVPVAGLHGTADGELSWSDATFKAGLPLRMWEDSDLQVPSGASRDAWLSAWHTDREWLEAAHRTRYSDGVIGVYEQFVREAPLACDDPMAPPADAALIERFEAHRRRLVEPDLLLLANDHWNFNARAFNPGGNHGSFFRISTHSILMFAGGENTGIPQAQVVTEPYDSLSFAPTLLKLAGFHISGMPGPIIRELFR